MFLVNSIISIFLNVIVILFFFLFVGKRYQISESNHLRSPALTVFSITKTVSPNGSLPLKRFMNLRGSFFYRLGIQSGEMKTVTVH